MGVKTFFKYKLRGVDFNKTNLSQADLSEADLSQANLKEANLKETVLRWANIADAELFKIDLEGADLYEATLVRSNLASAILFKTNLIGVHLCEANLNKANLSRANLSRANLSRAALRGADLTGADLTGADLRGADLRGADLRGAVLTETDFSMTKCFKTNFNDTVMTGVCIENWSIDSTTKLLNIQCDYVYLKDKQQERRPRSGNFEPNDFVVLFQRTLDTIDLIFQEGIDWKAFFLSFQELRRHYVDKELAIQAIEKQRNSAFVVHLESSPEVDKAVIERLAKELYTEQLNRLEESYQVQIHSQAENLKHERQRNSQLMRVVEVMAENTGPKYDLRNAKIGSLADTVKGNARQQANQHNYAPEQQPLAEAAAEIQQLLKQLEQINPKYNARAEKGFCRHGNIPNT